MKTEEIVGPPKSGKTDRAVARAVLLAREGHRVLILTDDNARAIDRRLNKIAGDKERAQIALSCGGSLSEAQSLAKRDDSVLIIDGGRARFPL